MLGLASKSWAVLIAIGVAIVLTGLLGWDRPSSGTGQAYGEDPPLEVISTRLSAAGYMVECRYRYLEPATSKALEGLSPYLLVETGGKRLTPAAGRKQVYVPATDKEGRVYVAFFVNPNRRVKSGDVVTLVLGNARVAGLRVK